MKLSDIIENARKCMKNLYNWSKAVDQLVISVTELLELVHCFLKEFEDILGRPAILEFVGKWRFGEVYTSVLAVVSQGRIENDVKVGSGDPRRGHESEGSERRCWMRREVERGT
jgi:hypothetical protein